jgi:hypothetical protein
MVIIFVDLIILGIPSTLKGLNLKDSSVRCFFGLRQSLRVYIESIYKFFEFGPLITKVMHNLAHLAL